VAELIGKFSADPGNPKVSSGCPNVVACKAQPLLHFMMTHQVHEDACLNLGSVVYRRAGADEWSALQIPYTIIRGNSNHLYRPIQNQGNGVWGCAALLRGSRSLASCIQQSDLHVPSARPYMTLPCCGLAKLGVRSPRGRLSSLACMQVCAEPSHHFAHHRLRIRNRHHIGRCFELPQGADILHLAHVWCGVGSDDECRPNVAACRAG
jgi:hypothetical protein